MTAAASASSPRPRRRSRPRPDFCFPVTRRALARINRLRLALRLDFWPAAAFAVFGTAAAAERAGAEIRIPDTFRAAAARRYAAAPGGTFGQLVPVREAEPDAATRDFLTRIAARHDLTPARAAMALAEWWGSGQPTWEGAPDA